MKWGLTLLKAALLVLLLAACRQQNTPTPALNDVEMSVRVEPERLAVGEATLIVTLRDASGSPIDGATLRVNGNMDHAGMAPVNREVNTSANGEYRVPFEWTMGGGWIVTVTAQLPDDRGEINQTFNFFVEAVSSESVINRPAGSSEATAESTVRIAYQPDSAPTLAGDSVVTITLTGADGSPISGALVEVVGTMARAGMMSISGKGSHTGNGQYVVPLRWTMAGDWQVTVKVTFADGQQVEQVFDQQVVMP